MNIKNMIEANAKIQVVVSLADLKEAFLEWQKENDEEKKRLQEDADKNKQLISANKACEMLGVSRSTLWHWDNEGYLKKIKIGNKVRYRLGDVLRIRKESESC